MYEDMSKVKQGDSVAIYSGGYCNSMSTGVVEKITPSGLIKVNGMLYYTNGMARGCGGHIGILTDQLKIDIENKQLIEKANAKIRRLRYDDITPDLARAILDAFAKYGK